MFKVVLLLFSISFFPTFSMELELDFIQLNAFESELKFLKGEISDDLARFDETLWRVELFEEEINDLRNDPYRVNQKVINRLVDKRLRPYVEDLRKNILNIPEVSSLVYTGEFIPLNLKNADVVSIKKYMEEAIELEKEIDRSREIGDSLGQTLENIYNDLLRPSFSGYQRRDIVKFSNMAREGFRKLKSEI